MAAIHPPENPAQAFRFVDHRLIYLGFVHTCNEKEMVADRIGHEFHLINPRLQARALRMFDAGVGDGSVLTQVMESAHDRFPFVPHYVVGKEISIEDVRLTLPKMADRFVEHPLTVLTLTNMAYADAPWLALQKAGPDISWMEFAIRGDTAHQIKSQLRELEPFLTENWKTRVSPVTGNPVYERPAVVVIYREDRHFPLSSIIPAQSKADANYDLVIASQPYQARGKLEFKAKRVIAPLARALGSGGRLIGIHSQGGDPAEEIVRAIWPEQKSFIHSGLDIIDAVKHELTAHDAHAPGFTFDVDSEPLRYKLRPLSAEGGSIGTSGVNAAWIAATYVAQIEDQRMRETTSNDNYLEITRDVLARHGGQLSFNDAVYTIARAGL